MYALLAGGPRVVGTVLGVSVGGSVPHNGPM